jgi:hypothetical protein
MIAAINPSKTLQKPLEAILKPSKGFSLSVAHQIARTQSRGSTLTACGRATLDGVKRHPHPRGCSSLELLPLAPPRIGNGAKPRIWVKGRVPCGVQGRSPLPCLASLILCRNRKSGKQDIPELRLQSGTALRAYLAKLRLDCHTSSGSTLAATADL